MQILKYYSVNNQYYKNNVNKIDSRYTSFQSRGPSGLMLHSVGCAQPSAKVFADGWNRSAAEVAVHAVLQADGTVYQCLPWNYRGIHCGGSANNTHVGVEMTEPSQIKYVGGASFTVSDRAAAQAQARGTYNTAVELFAQLCRTYGLNPLTQIISHHEGYLKGVASGHMDPEHLWKGLGLGYTMDTFRQAVKDRMEGNAAYASGWQQTDKGWWYCYSDGSWATGWALIDAKWYWFDAQGYMAADKVLTIDGKTYKFDANGHPTEIKEVDDEMRYDKVKDVPDYARATVDKLVAKGILNGKSGSGEDLVIDLGEDAIRLLVILDRAGNFG